VSPVTVAALAERALGRRAVTGADYEEAGLPMLGGCEVCGASVAAYNACPSRSGYLRCLHGCVGEDGWESVEEAYEEVFGCQR